VPFSLERGDEFVEARPICPESVGEDNAGLARHGISSYGEVKYVTLHHIARSVALLCVMVRRVAQSQSFGLHNRVLRS